MVKIQIKPIKKQEVLFVDEDEQSGLVWHVACSCLVSKKLNVQSVKDDNQVLAFFSFLSDDVSAFLLRCKKKRHKKINTQQIEAHPPI